MIIVDGLQIYNFYICVIVTDLSIDIKSIFFYYLWIFNGRYLRISAFPSPHKYCILIIVYAMKKQIRKLQLLNSPTDESEPPRDWLRNHYK